MRVGVVRGGIEAQKADGALTGSHHKAETDGRADAERLAAVKGLRPWLKMSGEFCGWHGWDPPLEWVGVGARRSEQLPCSPDVCREAAIVGLVQRGNVIEEPVLQVVIGTGR